MTSKPEINKLVSKRNDTTCLQRHKRKTKQCRRCKQIELQKSSAYGVAQKLARQVRKGKSSDLLFTDEGEQMKRNRRRTDEAAPTEQMKNRKNYEQQVKNAEEKINR
ncbi:hypothetical protein LOTGIDRAFT_175495 [Lottia gigantea]|uniref:Uncharacterized protein n=1 Tax=Lottia gigantea TaxID=225164 RepID=V4BYA7_LOTGI|nr:hypothetical protein LOTGIDRAFT_175495 [Lottia gigantea]ESO94109.1 hypothetical protein LOTGIDRAFT_175495 [Lottia gigantea]